MIPCVNVSNSSAVITTGFLSLHKRFDQIVAFSGIGINAVVIVMDWMVVTRIIQYVGGAWWAVLLIKG